MSFRQILPNKLCQKFLPNEIGLIGSQKENNKQHFYQKSSLESMLSLIKNTQLEYLSLLNDKRQNCINKKEKEKSVN